MKITSRMVEDEVFEAQNEAGICSLMDMRGSDKKQSLNPPEVLLGALASCGGVDVVTMLRKRKKTIINFFIETEGIRNEIPPRYFKKIHLLFTLESPDIAEKELYKWVNLALKKYCTVASSLKSEISFSVKVIQP